MSSETDENAYFITATRKLDKRKIYVKSVVRIQLWVELCDELIDCEFVLKKIDEAEFLVAIDRSQYIYYITQDNHQRFQDFIHGNYLKIKKPPH